MRTSKPHQVRLNPKDEALLNQLIESTTEETLTLMIEADRSHREGYRGYNGPKPSAHTLILRRAISIGLNAMTS